ncbi:hypothetical protein IW261DRAFT_1478338 [Armillaria novae-zelandiae]|uniref:Uncharacterized protein n=1 Tax=Armillaria novae-zelandiae TaxID=153914 RepID=A0AA39P8L2_9AGAR|nr:hypothetical protein IW261DRAFT_1478338 [Armillaria novae-zelandiae]
MYRIFNRFSWLCLGYALYNRGGAPRSAIPTVLSLPYHFHFSSINMQADLPPDVTSTYVTSVLAILDNDINRVILAADLLGLYSGILAAALWTIFMQKSRPVAVALIAIIVVVYIMTVASFSIDWLTVRSALVGRENIVTQVARIEETESTMIIATGIMAALSTLLVDSIMIWRCWLVWGQRWQIVLLPSLCLAAGIVCKIVITKQRYLYYADVSVLLSVYAGLVLATTLLCALLVIYRILTVARGTDGGGNGPRTYRHVIEVFIESSALYAVSLIVYVACIACNVGLTYVDAIAGFTRGIAPTLLLGRVAAGHARPDDSWKGSVITSSLHFGQDNVRSSFQDNSVVPGLSGSEDEFEAQPGNPRKVEHSCMGLREDAEQGGSVATKNLSCLGLAEDDPEARIVKAIH